MKNFIALFAVALGLCIVPRASVAKPSAPILQSFAYLQGHWHCTSNAGGKNQTYETTWSYILGNAWIRSSESSASETSITHLPTPNGLWELVHLSSDGAMLFVGNGDDPQHLDLHSVVPKRTVNLRFDRVSDTAYTLTFSGAFSGQDRCSKE